MVSVYRDLGVSHAWRHKWPAHLITEVNSKDGYIHLENSNEKIIRVNADSLSLDNILNVIDNSRFKNKFGDEFQSTIESWNFTLTKESTQFFLVIRTTLKPEDQNSRKRKRMYHRMNAHVSKEFILNLLHETS